MFLAYHFNSFDFVAVTVFLKSLVILLITPFTAFSSGNSDMYKIISPKNLKRSNSTNFKVMIFKHAFSFFFHHLSHNFYNFLHQLQ